MTDHRPPPAWRRAAVLGDGLLAYVTFLASMLYCVGFLANVGVPSGIDEGTVVPLREAVAVDVGSVALFGIQHSVMARGWFEDRWTRVVPEPVERITYVLLVAIAWV